MLSEYEVRVLREMEAEFARRPRRLRSWLSRLGLLLAVASLVVVVFLALVLGVAVAAPVAFGSALVAGAATLAGRRWHPGGL
jgi:hypothetical protein